MSAWTHLICPSCWNAKNPKRPAPKPKVMATALCCFCGLWCAPEIYVRGDPTKLRCRGDGSQHEDKDDET